MRIVIITALFVSASDISAQSGWFWMSPKYSVEVLNDIEIINQTTGYITGQTGTFMITTDAGFTWSNSINSSNANGLTPERFFGSFFINEHTGWIVGMNGNQPPLRLFKTTNAGKNWTRQATDLSYNFPSDVYFLNYNTGFVAGTGYILRTVNSGANWEKFTLPHTGAIEAFYFLNNEMGWAAGDGYNYKTTDSGLSWFEANNHSPFHAYDIYFFNESTGFTVGWFLSKATVYKTTDGGNHWLVKTQTAPGKFSSVCFVNNYTGWAVGGHFSYDPQLIMKTTNAGENWTQVNTGDTGYPSYLCSVKFFNENTGIAAGYGGAILRTTNGGENWIEIDPMKFKSNTNKVRFVNSTTGWLIGSSLLRTTNGGRTWIIINTGYQDEFQNCYLPDGECGYFLSSNRFYKTTNGGLNWSSTYFPKIIKSMDFVDSNTGFMAAYVADGMYIHTTQFKTTNAGDSWDTVVLPYIYPQLIDYWDQNTGWLVGNGYLDNRIYKTTNQGVNWVLQYTGSHYYNDLSSMYLLNENTGWISGEENVLLKTTNGGENWISLDFGFPQIWTAPEIQFVNQNLGWVLVNYPSAQILKTTNGGLNWYSLFDCGIYGLNSMYFLNRMTGWAAGENILIKTTNGGELITAIQSITSAEFPDKYSLSQNYPNPFNPVTKIKFDIPLDSRLRGNDNVTLKIYDILGREIATLVNEGLQPGTYDVEWDGTNYCSGVYFYVLITAEYSETKKMVLIK